MFVAGTVAAVSVTALAACSDSSDSSDSATGSTASDAEVTAVADGEAAEGSVAALAQAFYNTLDEDQQSAVLLDYALSDAERWSNLPEGLLTGGAGGGMPSGGSMPSDGGGDMPSGMPSDGGGQMPSGGASDGGGMTAPSDAGGATSTGSSSSGRPGIDLGQLDDDQLAAFDALLKAATGTAEGLGYDEIQSHLAAGDYLAENGGGDTYGRGNFYVAILGSPQDSGTWELMFGGHHLAVSNTYIDGKLAGATPSFRGIEPLGDFELDGTTYNAFKTKTDAFTALLAALDDTQLAAAELADTYSDLVLGPGNDWAFPETKEGLQVSELSEDVQGLLLDAIATYVDDVSDAEAATILSGYESELPDTYLAYSGTTAFTEKDDYIRVDGPSVWIELSLQSGIVLSGNHPHTVWRDRTTDYGGTQS